MSGYKIRIGAFPGLMRDSGSKKMKNLFLWEIKKRRVNEFDYE